VGDSVTKCLYFYYSSCGYIEIMASAVANRPRYAGVNVAPTPLATVAELVAYDAPVLLAPVYALPRPLPSSSSLPPKQPSCLSTPGGSSWRGSI
jgi:hypothetical protein